eukprot:5579036-Prymnesium_polylepis.1
MSCCDAPSLPPSGRDRVAGLAWPIEATVGRVRRSRLAELAGLGRAGLLPAVTNGRAGLLEVTVWRRV